jgi:NAD(P)-dependent dehydrogenase (short-subunit alcohol dehydrogenase family)
MATALVTGGNRGLGLETCRQLAARGYSVLLAARNEGEGRQAAAALSGDVRAVPLDVESESSVQALAQRLGNLRLNALVNNAGASFHGFDAEIAERTIEVNYRGARRVSEAFLPLLVPGANVVMVSSGLGTLEHLSPELAARFRDPTLDRAKLDALVEAFIAAVREGGSLGGFPRHAYRVSKIALNAYTRLLAAELSERGIRVNAVCPGWVRTRMGTRRASRSVEQGARGIVWAAALGEAGPSGGFFRDGSAIDW